ncbi:hypothetical protein BDZ89DRAFT_1084587 [Hymenopellis radicata]|nr:hypothetical protein BDZ89DRAFT_1084587 [Hymenopellis radicata]
MTDGKNLLMPFDLQIGAPPSQQQTSMDLLMGTFIWRRISTRESRLIRIFRGCSAIILFAIFIVFAFTSIVFRPLSGQGMGIRVKTYRTRKLDSSITGQLPLDPMWSVFVAVYYDQQYINKTEFPGASSLAYGRLDAVIRSSAIRTAYSLAQYPAPLIYGFSCPGNYIFNLGLRRDSPAPFYYDAMDTPDLLVTVNFTALDLLPSSNNTVPGFRKSPDSVSVFVGTINDIVDVFDNTQAAVLMPGQHLMSGMDAHIRQRFAWNGAVTFGIASLSKMRTFLVTDLVGLMPNPSTDIARENNTASLYLYMYPHRVSEWTIVADTQEDTVLSGLSLVGGFWTFANGLVAFFFGSRLVLIFFGNKPISPFGLIHRFRRVELTDSYPRLMSDDGGSAAERGLAAFLRDHVVDLGSVDVSNTKNVAGTDNTEMEPLPMLCRSDTEKEEASLYSRANDNLPQPK